MDTDDPRWLIHTLIQFETVTGPVLTEADRLLKEAKGELNVIASEKWHRMIQRTIAGLYRTCIRLGLKDDADLLLHGEKSPTLEAFRMKTMLAIGE